MKIKDLMSDAKNQIDEELKERALGKLKQSLKNIKDCERTLRKLKESHSELLESEVEDLEEMEY